MIKFYHTETCGKCKVLEIKLKELGFEYESITDLDVMQQMGLQHVPWLEVDGVLMDCSESLKWLRQKKKEMMPN